jgi:hypothetical protein
MQWQCPACQSEISHSSVDVFPDPAESYRCHVCRLDLRFNVDTRTMVVATLDSHIPGPDYGPRTPPAPLQPIRRKSSR